MPAVVWPSILFSRAGSVGASTSTTFICLACCSSRLEALRTASAAQAALRWWNFIRLVSEATASLITLRRRSEPRFWPLESIGVEEPMLVAGAIAATSAASVIQTPAEAARAPLGDT